MLPEELSEGYFSEFARPFSPAVRFNPGTVAPEAELGLLAT
jgi:hypothetical protein